jgi:type II secretory ATPase GspE/PulE/Tfp pilus assembly ATPase PilB-like protein
MFILPQAIPSFAALSLPSLNGFPLVGLLWFLLLLLLAVVGLGGAIWMAKEHEEHGIAQADRWFLAIGLVLVAVLVGVLQIGPIALLPAAPAMATTLFYFTKQRDKRVEKSRRILTKDFVTNIRATIREHIASSAAVSPGNAPREPLLARLKSVMLKLNERAVKKSQTAKKKEARPELPDFVLLKKDGSLAMDIDKTEAELSENVVNMRAILIEGMRLAATDIHMEPHDKQYAIRYRIDGVLQDSKQLPIPVGKGVISAMKVVADMDIAERRRPQDGGFAAVFQKTKFDVRAACSPTSYGEKMVLRLLNSSGGVMSAGLGNIGLRTQILESLREVIHKPYGMFLVTGPTGSGKTTTVYASLSEIDAKQHNITTIEDPVEYRLDGITQIAVNSQAGVTFAGILRSILRQDPDVLLVGEIRDKETAEIACQAALTGHFVFSTLHANDTVATITRMLDLGLDPMLVQTAVTAVLGQRLARKLCLACREPYAPPGDLLKKVGLKPGVIKEIFREKGCEACGGTGFKGRIGLHELMVMNDEIRGLITESPNLEELKRVARKAGTQSLQTDGLLKVLKGITSLSEIVRVTTS